MDKKTARLTELIIRTAEKNENNSHSMKKFIADEKRALRAYYHRGLSTEIVIHGEDWTEGKLVKGVFPKFVKTKEEAEEYFIKHLYIPVSYEEYDCTGKEFTNWYNIVNLHGELVYYHQISIDI